MLRLEYGRMLQDGLDGAHGLSRPQLQELVRKFGAVRDEVRTRRAAGEYGFYGLAEQGATIKPIEPPKLIEEDEEEDVAVPPQIFQTLMGRALPEPASEKAFQTLMMQAVALPSLQATNPTAAPAGQTAKPVASQAHPVTPAAVTPPAVSQARGPAVAPRAAPPLPPAAPTASSTERPRVRCA